MVKICRWRLIIAVILVCSLTVGDMVLPMMPVAAAESYGGLAYMVDTTCGSVETSNSTENDYFVMARRICSYLKEMPDGYVILQTNLSEEVDEIVVNQYSQSFAMTAERVLKKELPIFGGCFMGDSYFFLVFGQKNQSESDDVEVLRIVKYDKEWNRLASQSVYGANTREPFAGGSLRMTETDGMLYIHTCHQMYASSKDGLNHQANMTYVMDQNTMQITQSCYNVSSDWWYVSHSFNQYVKTDGRYLYLVDQGDAYPRGVVLDKVDLGDITKYNRKRDRVKLFPIQGNTGANDTGVSVGGFEIAGDCLVTVGNSVSQDDALDYDANGPRNIFVTSTDTGLGGTQTTWLTSYGEKDAKYIGTPHLVKASDNDLYVLWAEWIDDGSELYALREEGLDEYAHSGELIKLAHIDAQGKQQGEVYTFYGWLSDCAPVYTSQGEIVWYTTINGNVTFYHIDPERLSEYKSTISISVSPEELVFNKWSSRIVTARVVPDIKFKWESDNEAVVKVVNENYGIVQPVSNGTANLIVRAGDETATVKVTVDIKENSSDSSKQPQDTSDKNNQTQMPATDAVHEKGDHIRDNVSKAVYEITKEASESGKGGTVAYAAPADKRVSSAQIPKTVTLDGVKYKVTSVAANAFKNNKSLKKVTIGTNVTSIESNAFYKCTKLKIVTIGSNVRTIGAKAFSGCTSLTKVVLPAKTTSIGKQAFYKCAKLKTITIGTTKLTAKTVGAEVFKGVYAKATVKVPAKAYSRYKKLLPSCGLSKKAKIVKQ